MGKTIQISFCPSLDNSSPSPDSVKFSRVDFQDAVEQTSPRENVSTKQTNMENKFKDLSISFLTSDPNLEYRFVLFLRRHISEWPDGTFISEKTFVDPLTTNSEPIFETTHIF